MKTQNNNVIVNQFPMVKPNVSEGFLYVFTDGDVYVVARIDRECYALICIQDGTRYANGVKDINNVFSGDDLDFTRISKVTVIDKDLIDNE